MSVIFLIHQSIHFWGASTARHGNLRFNHAEQFRIENKRRNLHNVRICNGREPQPPLKNTSGVLVVECFKRNCNSQQEGNPTDAFNYTVTIIVPKNTNSNANTDTNDGINILLQITTCKDPNVTISSTSSANIIGVSDVTAGTVLETFSV
jgi:hypothetical protein